MGENGPTAGGLPRDDAIGGSGENGPTAVDTVAPGLVWHGVLCGTGFQPVKITGDKPVPHFVVSQSRTYQSHG